MQKEDIDIAIIQETKLHSPNKTPHISNYTCVRHDRKDEGNVHTGGGLIFYIKANLPFVPTSSSSPQNIEYQSIKIPLTSYKFLTITNIYIPQRTASTTQQTEDANITTLLTQVFNIPNSLICRDANAHSNVWYANQTPDHIGDLIASLVQSSEHLILNKTPTHALLLNQPRNPQPPTSYSYPPLWQIKHHGKQKPHCPVCGWLLALLGCEH